MTRKTWNRKLVTTLAIAVGMAFGSVAWAAEATPKEAKQWLETYKKADPELSKTLADSAGYAVFPSVAKGGFGVGAASGKGVLFEKGVATGRVSLTQLTVGAQVGGQTYSELIVFEDAETLANFKRGNFALSAAASAIAAKEGASATARYEDGVQIYTIGRGGLMVEASVGGQKFSFTPYGKEKIGALVR